MGYVDYGNFEILSLKRLCPIIPKLLDLPMQALNCVLAGMECCGPLGQTLRHEDGSVRMRVV